MKSFKEFQLAIYSWQRILADFIKRHRTVKLIHLLRNYSALAVVVSSAVLVMATNVASGKNSSGLLFGYWGNDNSQFLAASTRSVSQESRNDNLALAPISKAPNAVDPEFKEEEDKGLVIQGQTMVQSTNSPQKDPEEEGGVKIYEVKPGDTVSSIALNFKITQNTILWANDIENVDDIQPGDKIFILPVSGVPYTVKKGDKLKEIAQKYKADEQKIIEYNGLPADGEIEEGKEIIIPGGKKDTPQGTLPTAVVARRQYANTSGGTPEISGWRKLEGKAGTGHRFPYGYCTWYVAQRRFVPWSGNAGTWLYNAKSMGYKTGKVPTVGSIMVSSESWWGHVAVVEKVSGEMITISEMNYKGWAKKSSRTLSYKSRVIKGFIY